MHSCINNNDAKKMFFDFALIVNHLCIIWGGFIVEFWRFFRIFIITARKTNRRAQRRVVRISSRRRINNKMTQRHWALCRSGLVVIHIRPGAYSIYVK